MLPPPPAALPVRRRAWRGTVPLLTALLALVVAPAPAGAGPDAGATPEAVRPPAFLTGPQRGEPDDIAIRYLRAHPARHGVGRADLTDLAVASRYTSRHNGVTHVNLSQRFRDLEVFGATATVNVARNGSVVFVRGTRGCSATGPVRPGTPWCPVPGSPSGRSRRGWDGTRPPTGCAWPGNW